MRKNATLTKSQELFMFKGTFRVLRGIFKGYAFIQSCSKLLIERIFHYNFFWSDHSVSLKGGGRIIFSTINIPNVRNVVMVNGNVTENKLFLPMSV